MARDKDFHDYILHDVFAGLFGINSRAMFGGLGFSDIEEFCGLDVLCVTKSASLLSVSSLFPLSSSSPPKAIVISVEDASAFRSMLPFAAGFAE